MNTPCGEAQGNARNINGRDNIAAYGTTKDRHEMATNGRRTGGETAGSERDKK